MSHPLDDIDAQRTEHCQAILPRLYIGDYQASQDADILTNHRLRFVVAAMKQDYTPRHGIELLRIPVDDTDKTNIIEHFDATSAWIEEKFKQDDEGCVLVHCLAGVSRSTTLVAAYLMKMEGMTATEAIDHISSKRPQVQPTEFFLSQLEMYERCECEWNPSRWTEQRRFVMAFVADQMAGNGASKLVLAYYPSPAPSPRPRTPSDPMGMAMTPLDFTSVNTPSPSTPHSTFQDEPIPPVRQRLTKRSNPAPIIQTPRPRPKKEVEKLGTKSTVIIRGRRLRCKMCRRELAGRDHVLVHEPGVSTLPGHKNAFGVLKQTRKFDETSALSEDKRTASDQSDESPLEPLAEDTSRQSHDSTLPGIAKLRVSMPIRFVDVPNSEAFTSSEQLPAPEISPPLASPSSFPITRPNSPAIVSSSHCSSYFLEPLSWMQPCLQTGELQGKLVCPSSRCKSKLGSFDWSGQQCSCGFWSVPAFQILKSKVDEISL